MSLSVVLDGRPAAVPFFFFNDTATTEIYTLSLHDALPILRRRRLGLRPHPAVGGGRRVACGERQPHHRRHGERGCRQDRKSTRLNSSHQIISYAVFCLKKKNEKIIEIDPPSAQVTRVCHSR